MTSASHHTLTRHLSTARATAPGFLAGHVISRDAPEIIYYIYICPSLRAWAYTVRIIGKSKVAMVIPLGHVQLLGEKTKFNLHSPTFVYTQVYEYQSRVTSVSYSICFITFIKKKQLCMGCSGTISISKLSKC